MQTGTGPRAAWEGEEAAARLAGIGIARASRSGASMCMPAASPEKLPMRQAL